MLKTIIIIALMFSSGAAYACSCAALGTPREHVENTDIIAFGMNTDARLLSAAEQLELFSDDPFFKHIAVTTFVVETPIKGVKTGQVISLYYDVGGSTCSRPPFVGASEILFINEYRGEYFVFSCLNINVYSSPERDEYLRIFEEISGYRSRYH